MVVAYKVPPQVGMDACCPECGWRLKAPAGDVLAIGRCTVELERHLLKLHGFRPEAAEATAESWALQRMRDLCR